MNPRLCLAPLLVLLCAAGARADYLLIRVNLEKLHLDLQHEQKGPGMPGFGPGQPGGGMAGFRGGPGAGGMGGAGMGGGGFGGFRGGAGGGFMGASAPPGAGNPAGPGKQPGPMGMGFMGVGNPMGGGQVVLDQPFDPTMPWVGAFVELQGKNKQHQTAAGPVIEIRTRYGAHFPIPANPQARGAIDVQNVEYRPLRPKFDRELSKILKEESDKVPALVRLANWALRHGLTDKCYVAVDELAKVSPKHPIVKNVARVRDILKKPLDDKNLPIRALADKTFRLVPSMKGHYGLLTNIAFTPLNQATLQRRLNQFEDTFENFYLWFALQDDVPQPAAPKQLQLVVLCNTIDDFFKRHDEYGSPPIIADAFTIPRDNVVVLSAQRVDDNIVMFAKKVDSMLQTVGAGREEFLTGRIWARPEAQMPNRIGPYAYLQTLNLLLKLLEDEGELAAITHEGTRQLLVSSELLPRYVAVPDWLAIGLASYFESPPGAVFNGIGLPSWTNLISFKYHRATGKLSKAAPVLMKVLDDSYFDETRRALKDWRDDRDNHRLLVRAKEDSEVAQCTAWALVYYLAQTRQMGKLVRYAQEMQQLPRDFDLDRNVLQGCFAKAFELSDRSDPSRLDPQAVDRFAEGWFAEMENNTLEIGIVEQELITQRQAAGHGHGPGRRGPPPKDGTLP